MFGDGTVEVIFEEYRAGATYRQLGQRYGLTETKLHYLIRDAGGIDERWSRISREAREQSMQDRVTHIAGLAREVFALRPGRIWSDSRERDVVRARDTVFVAAFEAGSTFAAIGRAFGMDHTSVMAGYRRATIHAERDADYRANIDRVRALVAA